LVTHQSTALKTWLQITSRRGRLGNMVTCHDPALAGLATWLQITSFGMLGYTSRPSNPSRVLLSLLHTPQTYLRNVDEVSGTDPFASVSPERHSHPRHMFHIIYTHTHNTRTLQLVCQNSITPVTVTTGPQDTSSYINARSLLTHLRSNRPLPRTTVPGHFHARQYLNSSTATFQ